MYDRTFPMSTEGKQTSLSLAFGRAVRSLRNKKGISQEKFALKCDLDRAFIGRVERGFRHPSIKTIWIISKGLEARPRDLIALTEKELERDSTDQVAVGRKQKAVGKKAKTNR